MANKKIFEDKDKVSRKELRKGLKRTSPGFHSFRKKRLSRRERVKLEREVFGKKYGKHISKQDYKKAVDKFRKKTAIARTPEEKAEIKRKVKFLRKAADL